MNERIRELREQAWALVSDEERDCGELYETRERWERCDQKFAELIVQECAKMVDTDGDAVMALRIMKHFGVGE